MYRIEDGEGISRMTKEITREKKREDKERIRRG